MLDITDPTIFVDANAAFRQLTERGQLVPENGELKIELYGELAALLKLGTEPKTNTPRPKARGCKYRWLRGHATAVTCTLILLL
jgi:hypothetical protein